MHQIYTNGPEAVYIYKTNSHKKPDTPNLQKINILEGWGDLPSSPPTTNRVNGIDIKKNECKKFLKINVDCRPKFKNYLDGVIKRFNHKINIL